ncbi:piggyBac transposable element-derived protein 1-like [Homalodisca vitripennis]|uniref:piggyBac transposable element-derived protein 1-like n=1 Tax=Homalodisca vitripennis TaxID=197043 RepID=UPI001EEBF1E9|nr:piggyBac transposable element-derived protein 1-like [Homalodisca vitripennis]
MDLSEENRLARLLLSVEREENEVLGRPTGAFVRQLFNESDEEDTNVAGSDDDEGHVHLAQELEGNEVQGHEEGSVFLGNMSDDFDELDIIPIHNRLHGDIVTKADGSQAYISRNRKMLWNMQPSQERRTPARNILRMRMGCTVGVAKDAKTALDIWSLFFTDSMILDITQSTNVWINSNKERYSRERDAKETTPEELKCVFGILYMAGVMKSSHQILEELWSGDGFGVEFFRCAMSIKRFKFLLTAMRFDDITSREDRQKLDNLAPIRDLFEEFVENCKLHYRVSEFVTLDEMLESFRGRCSFRQYIKNKPAKYGLKIYALVCAKTFYTANLEVYAARQPPGPYQIDNSARSVVQRMIEPISGSGRNVTMDNWFSSVPLCFDLMNDHRLTMVGTLRKNKREIPSAFLETKHRPVNSSMFAFKDKCTMVSFVSNKKKHVVLVSTLHNDDTVDNNPNSPTVGKPEIVLFYNSSKGGVDTVDKYKESYSTARVCNRWSMRIFYSLLDIGALNTFIILKENAKEPKMKRRIFLRTLAKELCQDHMRSRITIRSTPANVKLRICKIMEIADPRPTRSAPPEDVQSARCYSCDWRKHRLSKTRCSKCKFFICREHTAPAICVMCTESRVPSEEDMSE